MSYSHNQRKKAIKRGTATKGTKPEKWRELAKFINERNLQNATIPNLEATAQKP